MSSYPDWLSANHRANDRQALGDYVMEVIRAEGWLSEYKASASNVDYGVREAVCALANARGGEVFVGVTNQGVVDGTTVTREALNQTLRQQGASPGDWYETDLLRLCEILPVPFPGAPRWAYAIQVRGPDRPTFIFENGQYIMAKRSGSDSIRTVDSREAMAWFREWRRGDILRKSYAELALYLGQLSLHRQLPDGLPDRLPFISKASEDGTLLTFLTADDLSKLLGSGIPGDGRSPGVVDLYYGVVSWAKDELARRPPANRFLALRDLGVATAGYGNLDKDILDRLAEFAQYVRSQGFVVP